MGRVGGCASVAARHREDRRGTSVAPWSRRPRRKERGASSMSKGTRSPMSAAPPLGVLTLLGPVAPPGSVPPRGSPNGRRSTRAAMLPAQLREPRGCGRVGRRRHGRAAARARGHRPTRPPVDLPAKYLSALAVLDELGPAARSACSTCERLEHRCSRPPEASVRGASAAQSACIDLVTMLDLVCSRPVQSSTTTRG